MSKHLKMRNTTNNNRNINTEIVFDYCTVLDSYTVVYLLTKASVSKPRRAPIEGCCHLANLKAWLLHHCLSVLNIWHQPASRNVSDKQMSCQCYTRHLAVANRSHSRSPTTWRSKVTQGHRKCYCLIELIWFPITVSSYRTITNTVVQKQWTSADSQLVNFSRIRVLF